MKSIRQYVEQSVKKFFDALRPTVLGEYKQEAQGKSIIFSSSAIPSEANLQRLFFANIQKTPSQLNKEEKDVLNDILTIANQYIAKLEETTTQNIKSRVIDHLLKARFSKTKPREDVIKGIMQEELDKSVSHFIKIAEAEGTKAKNMGALLRISEVADSINVQDATVFFVTSKDDKVCSECKRLHLLSDGVTPRVWKVSELKFTYHKKGESNPSVNGLHPHCRCSLTMLAPGFGFDSSGLVKFISINHDEYKKQRGGVR
jgi:hypothetical protein